VSLITKPIPLPTIRTLPSNMVAGHTPHIFMHADLTNGKAATASPIKCCHSLAASTGCILVATWSAPASRWFLWGKGHNLANTESAGLRVTSVVVLFWINVQHRTLNTEPWTSNMVFLPYLKSPIPGRYPTCLRFLRSCDTNAEIVWIRRLKAQQNSSFVRIAVIQPWFLLTNQIFTLVNWYCQLIQMFCAGITLPSLKVPWMFAKYNTTQKLDYWQNRR